MLYLAKLLNDEMAKSLPQSESNLTLTFIPFLFFICFVLQVADCYLVMAPENKLMATG
jgi:hypothetical protein